VQLPPGPAGESAEAAATARTAGPPADAAPPAADDVASPPRPRPTADVLDLGEASRDAVLKRAVPAGAALLVLLILIRILRRR
jgi:hypothetical protein